MTKTFQKCGEIGGSGELAPTSLDFAKINTSGFVHSTETQTGYGAQVTASITSATLTEVLSINGTGYFTFLGLLNSQNATVTDPKIRIIIDGVTVMDESSGTTITDAQYLAIIGIFNDVTGLVISTESIIHFKESFVVSIAGDGTDGVELGFKRVLT